MYENKLIFKWGGGGALLSIPLCVRGSQSIDQVGEVHLK